MTDEERITILEAKTASLQEELNKVKENMCGLELAVLRL